MVKKYIENTGPNAMFVGGCMIAPGEGREVETHEPEEAAPAQEQGPSLDAQLAEELTKPVKELIAGLAELTQEALERMEQLEGEAEKPRKSLLEAIATEKVSRANETMRLQELDAQLGEILAQPAGDVVAGLEAAEDEELARMAVLEQAAEAPRAEVLDAIAAEQAARAAA